MKQIRSVTLLLSLCSMGLFAQQEQVISSSGRFLENSTGSISFTLGECVTSTLSSSVLVLTQGFHQPRLTITDIGDVNGSDIEIAVFPNPVKEFISLQVESPRGLHYVLYDMNGVILELKEIVQAESEISFENLLPSVYIIKVFKDAIEVKTFKIIKQ